MDTVNVLVAALGAALALIAYLHFERERLRAEVMLSIAQRNRLVDEIAGMRRVEKQEREAGERLHARHRALTHRFASVLGEARAWRKRALALGWTKGGAA